MCSVFLQFLRIDDVLAKCICFYLYIRCCFNKLYSECDEDLYGWYICDWFSDQLSEYICWLITGKDIFIPGSIEKADSIDSTDLDSSCVYE